MKRWLVCSVVLLFLFSYSYASATCITTPLTLGVGDLVPDILVNTGARIDFDSGGTADDGGILTFTGDDLKITYSLLPIEVSETTITADFTLTLSIDGTGCITSGSMTEIATAGFTLNLAPGGPFSYSSGETLLSGPVTHMQWDNAKAGKARFAFVVQPVSGEFVTDGFWPGEPGTIVEGDSESDLYGAWPGPEWWNVDSDFFILKCKADKAPTPEPGTLLLLGSGLAGLAGYTRLRLSRKKKT